MEKGRWLWGVVWHLRGTERGWVPGATLCVSVTILRTPSRVQTERAQLEDGRFVYRLLRSPMCEYLVNFLHKLRQLPERYMMNSVLENFTILQVMCWGCAEQGPTCGRGCPPQALSPGDPFTGELTHWRPYSGPLT